MDLALAGKRTAMLTDGGLAPFASLRRLRHLRIIGARRVRGPGSCSPSNAPVAVPERSFYLLDAYDNAGFGHYRILHLSAELDEIAHALADFVADTDTSAMSIELRVYEASRRVSRRALRSPWKLPRVGPLCGTPLAPGERTAVRRGQ